MAEHRTCLQKYIEVCGHEEGCLLGKPTVFNDNAVSSWTGESPCTCSPSLDMLVAAGHGWLRKEHWWNGPLRGEAQHHCDYCGETCLLLGCADGKPHRIGPCYTPIDAAEAWRLLGDVLWVLNNELIAADRETYSVEQFKVQQRARLQWSIVQRGRLTIETISRLWIALHDSQLLGS